MCVEPRRSDCVERCWGGAQRAGRSRARASRRSRQYRRPNERVRRRSGRGHLCAEQGGVVEDQVGWLIAPPRISQSRAHRDGAGTWLDVAPGRVSVRHDLDQARGDREVMGAHRSCTGPANALLGRRELIVVSKKGTGPAVTVSAGRPQRSGRRGGGRGDDRGGSNRSAAAGGSRWVTSIEPPHGPETHRSRRTNLRRERGCSIRRADGRGYVSRSGTPNRGRACWTVRGTTSLLCMTLRVDSSVRAPWGGARGPADTA
jgi:hypothetical protein